jgi:hypothetical protein
MSWKVEYQIKLIKPNGLNRSFNADKLPSWSILSTKIESLYKIPAENVGVLYLDEGDEVTLNTEEELAEYYELHPPQRIDRNFATKLVMFMVIDLRDYQEKVAEPKPVADPSTGVNISEKVAELNLQPSTTLSSNSSNGPSESDALVISSDPLHVRPCNHQMLLPKSKFVN